MIFSLYENLRIPEVFVNYLLKEKLLAYFLSFLDRSDSLVPIFEHGAKRLKNPVI